MGIETEINCNLCGKSAELRHKSYPGYQEPLTFEIYHCEHCNTAFSMPRSIDSKQIYDLIYEKGDVVPGYDRYWKYAHKVKTSNTPLDYLAKSEEAYWGVREALIHIYAAKKPKSKILEIGSGLGYLTYSLRKAGYNAVGLDISEAAVKLAKDNYGDYYLADDLFQFADQNAGMYDVVIFTEVIEHVDSPTLFVESILKLLNSGGKAIITTPNKSLYSSDVVWESDLPPIHCWWFSEVSMEYIAQKLSAKVKFIDFSNFYSKFSYVDLDALKSKELPKSLFDENGNLHVGKRAKTKSKLRSSLARNPILTRIFYFFKIVTTGGIVRLKHRGLTLCAVLEKK